MASTFFGLSIGTSGLYASQASMNTSAHNIANSNTKGYTRQEVNLQASSPISTNSSYGMLGTGVDAKSITQIRDEYYDLKYRSNNAIYGSYSIKEYYFKNIENSISETNSDGLTTTFNDFYSALESLSVDVGDSTKRTQVASMAQGFTEFVNSIAENLAKLQNDCNTELKTSVGQINSISQQIATLNRQINIIELTGQHANDLRDTRNLLLDELSQYANISTEEVTASNGLSTIFTVRLDGQVLVDNYEFNTLSVQPRDTLFNQTDEDGMYKIVWDKSGQDFNETSRTLGGKLQALFEIRDGNNGEVVTGLANNGQNDNEVVLNKVVLKDLSVLNLPEKDGVLKIADTDYAYESFNIEKVSDNEYKITFKLKQPVTQKLNNAKLTAGKSVDCKGIPYYMNQLTTFARTFAEKFNEIHKSGEDLDGNKGVDFFTASSAITGTDYTLSKLANGENFDSVTTEKGGVIKASYYNLNCRNLTVAKSIMDDPSTIAASSNRNDGIENKEVLNKLLGLKSDEKMFKAGTPDDFLQKLTSDVGNDGKKAAKFTKSQEGIVAVIENQRMSVSSVDQDEESMNLVRFQNAYNLSAKAIQTLNEMYGTLINGLGL